MRSFVIDGRTIHYEVGTDHNEYDGDFYWTDFYEGYEEVVRTVWCGTLLSPFKTKKVGRNVPKYIFTLNHWNADDPRRTKSEWRAAIKRELELLGRKEELMRGELI